MKLDDALGIHPQALALRTRRAEVLAGNLANADTPGYKARDFAFKQLLSGELGPKVKLETTSKRHIRPPSTIVPAGQLGYRVPDQPSLDGNTVDTQREHVEYASNALGYEASLRFVNGKIRTLRKAIKGE